MDNKLKFQQLECYKLATDEQKENLKTTLKNQLEEILNSIFANPEKLIEKSENSVKRIKEMHDPILVEEKLKEIYNKS